MRAALVAVAGFSLAGCVDTLPQMQASTPSQATTIAARPGVSPSGASVAFVNLSGAPTAVGARFAGAMAEALAARAVVTDDPAKAHYLIRGHMSAWQAEGGTAIGYVWDIYDAKRRRLQRLEDEITVKGTGADPWSMADEKALASIAGRSADEIAAFLSNTPEAIAAASASGARPAASPAPGQQAAAPGAPVMAFAPVR